MNSLRALLAGLIDYAGLFPPASLSMEEAVRNYDSYLHGEHAWMLGRFILPSGRLAEFAAVHAQVARGTRWRLGVVAETGDAAAIREFKEQNAGSGPQLDEAELKAENDAEIQGARRTFGPSLALFFEAPLRSMPDMLPAMAEAESYAKVRTGGTTAEAIPNTSDLFNFLQSTIGTRVPFKATAGLHHPLRSEQPLTYGAHAPRAVMHGFVNLFVAAVVLYNRVNDDDALSILNETDPATFTFDDDELRWRDRVTLAAERIAEARRLALSFGSCSFDEPVADLRKLRWL